ncbi:MAG: hypothetical protein K6A63_06400 [Acholeplasmatales bacterium]|nr:hypothetical protein [Acholeplasmatales bacterium]
MKKKRILLGLALTAAAALSLASCGGSDDSKAASSAATTEVSSAAASSAATSSAATSSKATSSKAASSKAASSAAASSQAAVTEFTVTFYADAEATTALSTVKANEGDTVAAPTFTGTVPAGKKFDKWVYQSTGMSYSDTDPIMEDTAVIPSFVELGVYDTMAASSNCLMASDFTGVTLAEGSKFDATEPTFKSASAAGCTVSELGNVQLTSANFLADFGGDKTSGVITSYFEVTFSAFATEAFFQLDGTSAAKTSDTEVFALRTVSGALKYRFDGGTDTATSYTSTLAANTTYKFLVTLDLSEGTLKVSLDGTEILSVDTTINSVDGLKFTCKDTGATAKKVDNVAVTLEAKEKSALVLAKEAAVAELDALTLNSNTTIAAAEQEVIDAQKLVIAAADTTEAVAAAKKVATDYVAATKYVLTVTPYTAADTALTGVDSYEEVLLSTDTVDTTKISFTGYGISGFYTDAALTTAYTAGVLTADTTLYAMVAQQAEVTLSFTVAADSDLTALAAGVSSNGSLKTAQEDGGKTGTYNAIQLQYKSADSKDQNITAEFANAAASCTVDLTGWTGGSSSESEYVEVLAYDAAGSLVATVGGKTTAAKTYGAFATITVAPDDSTKTISKIVIHCKVDTKSYFVTAATITYSVA